jgi:hypothetical protein
MLTKAIIQSVDYSKNICRVRIPLFENAARNINMIEADAQFSIVPGVYNSYKTGDVVFISFEENKMESPVILGKLFVSASAEKESYRGNLSGNSLYITESTQLPHSTIFDYSKISQNDALYKNLDTPKKIADSILELQRAQIQKYQTIIKVVINDVTYNLYLKTSNDFTYTATTGSTIPLYKLCTALKNSGTNNIFIPLDTAITETLINGGEPNEKEYTLYQALFRIKGFDSTSLKFEVLLNGSLYEIDKEAISEIQSIPIQY